MLSRFAAGLPLPPGFGVGLEERCVEYPWMLSRLRDDAVRLLDAGSILNHGELLDLPTLHDRDIHILTLAPEPNCYWNRRISYLFGDLRDIPVRSAWYNTVICISTMEHIGMDCRRVTGGLSKPEDNPLDFLVAAAELRRVVRPGGHILVTVPYGRYQHLGYQQQFDAPLVARLIETFAPYTGVQTQYFRYSPEGWQVASPEACESAEYVGWAAEGYTTGFWPNPIPVEPDRARAARAVACIDATISC